MDLWILTCPGQQAVHYLNYSLSAYRIHETLGFRILNFLIPDFDSVNHVNRTNNSLPHFYTDFLTGT
jgi:hypothetical protein